MPKTKRKSVSQKNEANRFQMRDRRAARDEMVDIGVPGCSRADPVRSVSDGGPGRVTWVCVHGCLDHPH